MQLKKFFGQKFLPADCVCITCTVYLYNMIIDGGTHNEIGIEENDI